MDDQTLRNANAILIRFITDIDSKLRYGSKQRQNYLEAIDRGEEPKGYRVEYICKTVEQLIGWLSIKAKEFNDKYPQDRISVEDLMDILATTHAKLKSKTSGSH